MMVYLAQPIDQAVHAEHYAAIMSDDLTQRGHLVYRPRNAFDVSANPELHVGVERVNRTALAEAEVLVAVVPKGVPSVGVPREIEAFDQAGKPWAVLTNHSGSFSLMDAPFQATLDVDGCKAVAEWVSQLTPSVHGVARDLVFAKVEPFDGQLPTRAHPRDAGYDLYVAERTHIPYDAFADVPCGVRVALPPGIWARIIGRSSTLRRRSLLVAEGTIDEGYRGPLFAGVRNLNGKGVWVEQGERIAQLVPMYNIAPDFRPRWASAAEFGTIPHDGRGDNGFGSSGT